ncbi:MAG TPA: alginate export family protein [Burkholderiales bacterium]|nr:alginate export family protein [Burkholderiales bacterium]
MRNGVLGALLLVFGGAANAPAFAEGTDAASPLEAVEAGKPLITLRPRYEHVDQDGKPFDANALTMRTLLGWQTGSYAGFSGVAQAINVGRLNDNYNDTKNGRTQFPVVADPDVTDVNQLYLDYAGIPDTRVRAGKQIINLDNVRFIGNVDFRQIMQVFTGATVENKSLPDTALYAGHLTRLRTVFGDQQDIELEILHAAYEWSPGNKLVGYGYFDDSPKTASATGFADNSNRIAGLRADGAYPVGDKARLFYTAEYARQTAYADGDSRIDAHYMHLGAGGGAAAFYARFDYELLSSNNGVYGFQTPLGTNHLFQGWADQFLTTPPQGIRDRYVVVGGTLWQANLTAEAHDFRSDYGNIHYGQEIDFGVSYPLRKDLLAKLEYANFNEKDVLSGAARKPDTEKLWLTLVYNFQ